MVDNDVKDTTNDEQTLYDALASGNEVEVSRLLAAEEPTVETPVVEAEEEEEEVESTEEESPESEVVQEETPEEATSSESEAAPAAASTLTDDERKELHRLRSDAGRVPYMQRRLQELERQLRAPKQARSDNKEEVSTEGVELPPAVKARYDAIREVDPDLADALEETAKLAIVIANDKSKAEVDSYARAQEEREDEAFIQEQLVRLGQIVPDYQKAFNSPQWKQWKDTLTPGRRALAESMYADEVAQALRAFAYDMGQIYGNQNSGGNSAAQETPPVTPTDVQNARKKKVQASADIKSGTAKVGKELDADALYKEMYDQLAKESHLI